MNHLSVKTFVDNSYCYLQKGEDCLAKNKPRRPSALTLLVHLFLNAYQMGILHLCSAMDQLGFAFVSTRMEKRFQML